MNLFSDLRYAGRTLARRPGFAAAAILSLALGIGPCAVLVSLLDGLGLRPLPVERADRLVRVFASRDSISSESFSQPEYRELANQAAAFSGTAAYGLRGVALTGRDRTASVGMIALVSPNYFEVMGVRARAGRTLGSADDRESASPPVMISERLWKDRFSSDPAVSGREIEINKRPATVAGVLPRAFAGLDPLFAPDVWAVTAAWPALGGSRELDDRTNRFLHIVGRLRDGASMGEASAQIAGLTGGRVVSESDYRARVARIAGAVFGTIGLLVLLLACANVAGLLLARGEDRRHEIAVRLAIGARRARVIQQLLVESALLAAIAAAASVGLAWWLIRLIPAVIPPSPFPLGLEFRLDARVVLAAFGLSAIAVLVFGLAPALTSARGGTSEVLKSANTGIRTLRTRARHVLVAAQVAVSLTLLTNAAFLVRGVVNLNRVDAGIDRQPMLIVLLSPSAVGYDEQHSRAFYQALMDRAAALPGVQRVALAKRAPLSQNGGGATETVDVPGQTEAKVHFNTVGQGYFETIGTTLVRGRDFSSGDKPSTTRVAIASVAFARRFFGSEDVIGRQIAIGRARVPHTIVGLARDAKYNSLTESSDPYLYFAFSQRFAGEATLFVRVSGDERTLIPPLRQAITDTDRSVPAMQIMTLDGHLRAATAIERTTASIVSTLGALGLFLAVVGLYALMSFLVSCSVPEIGLRMALGASPAAIVRQTLGQAARPVGAGAAAGLLLAFAVASLIARSVYGVSQFDPRIYLTAVAILATVTAAASFLPARRASHVDPSEVLRRE